MQERRTNTLHYPTIPSFTMQSILHYVYTDQISPLQMPLGRVLELHDAARMLCLDSLCQRLDRDGLCSLRIDGVESVGMYCLAHACSHEALCARAARGIAGIAKVLLKTQAAMPTIPAPASCVLSLLQEPSFRFPYSESLSLLLFAWLVKCAREEGSEPVTDLLEFLGAELRPKAISACALFIPIASELNDGALFTDVRVQSSMQSCHYYKASGRYSRCLFRHLRIHSEPTEIKFELEGATVTVALSLTDLGVSFSNRKGRKVHFDIFFVNTVETLEGLLSSGKWTDKDSFSLSIAKFSALPDANAILMDIDVGIMDEQAQ